jgi:uncharacterized membrane protein
LWRRETALREYHKRSVVKAVCWRALATFSTIAIVYAFTGKAALSIGVGAVEVVVKIMLYYAHERVWDRIGWGKLQHPLAGLAVTRELEPAHLDEIRSRLEDLGYL